MYLGFSILRDGISFADINTAQERLLKGSGHIIYHLDISRFNAGAYQIGSGIFRAQNAELLGIANGKQQFIIKGNDPTRGGALKLSGSWDYE
jgi:hypothetical protein